MIEKLEEVNLINNGICPVCKKLHKNSIEASNCCKKVNKGFELKCLNCNSLNVNIDFENDVFWCGDCNNTTSCLDQLIKIKEMV